MRVRGPCALNLFYSWRLDPLALATAAVLQSGAVGDTTYFPPSAKLREEGGGRTHAGDLSVAKHRLGSLMEMSVSLPILLPWDPKLLQGPRGQSQPLVMNQTI